MAEEFIFTAPQSVIDFNKESDDVEDVGERYFDYEHEGTNGVFYIRKSISAGNIFNMKQNDKSSTTTNDLCNEMTKMKVTNKDLGSKLYTKSARRVRSSSTEQLNLNSKKSNKPFVSMAEAIRRYQVNTPERFRCRQKVPTFQHFQHLKCTIPHSPALCTKSRSRPVHCMSNLEKEEKELAQMKRDQIKANPVNPKVLAGCPIIKAQPKLNKQNPSATKVLPKSFLFALPANQMKLKPTKPLTCTIPQPFSFATRDLEASKRKELKIKTYLNEEKKLREFHAQKLPAYISSSSCGSSIKSGNSKENLNKTAVPTFKASTPTVLYKPPFQLKPASKILTQIENFELETDKRSESRKEFAALLKEKEELREQHLKEAELEKLACEEAERIELRRQTNFKAQCVKKFKPVERILSKPVTEPITPIFGRSKKIIKND